MSRQMWCAPHLSSSWGKISALLKSEPLSSVDDFCALYAIIHERKASPGFPSLRSCLTSMYSPPCSAPLSEQRLFEFIRDEACALPRRAAEIVSPFGVPLLTSEMVRSGQSPLHVQLSRPLVRSMLAAAVFGLWPTERGVEWNYPNLDEMFQHQSIGMLRCVLHYFERAAAAAPSDGVHTGTITLVRHRLDDAAVQERLQESTSAGRLLAPARVLPSGVIEDCADGAWADFANKYIGGGVMWSGRVQEEIMFVECTEALVSLILVDQLKSTDALLLSGVKRWSLHTGYASTFAWAGPNSPCPEVCQAYLSKSAVLNDCASGGGNTTGAASKQSPAASGSPPMAVDSTKDATAVLREEVIVAFDALEPQHDQWTLAAKMRELKKCTVAFDLLAQYSRHLAVSIGMPPCQPHLATGKWGCGAFGGHPELKVAIQWIAASLVGLARIDFYTFGDKHLEDVLTHAVGNQQAVSAVWAAVSKAADGAAKML